MTEVKTGIVKFFDKTRGFGFITEDEEKKDIYFRIVDVEKKETLETGEEVTFKTKRTPQGMKAVKIRRTSKQT